MKWTNKDWAWLVGVLTAIIILILTYRLSDNQEVTNLFSFISSSVSIALAIIAIFIALKQDSDGRRVNEQTSFLLNNIESKISNVDENIRKIDVGFISRAQETIESYTDEQDEKDNYTKEEVKQLLDNLGTELLEQVNEELERFPLANTKAIMNQTDRQEYSIVSKRKAEQRIIKDVIKSNKDMPMLALQEHLKDKYGIDVTLTTIGRMKNAITQVEGTYN
ncbi:hypothetical protein [Priestia megaterium]|uniref:hypothetical protein n=1 Tax=Priestia megaterium TaxID=1404 RepID=UPI002EB452D6|nr:hypothetical protein [Priestia megaterium]